VYKRQQRTLLVVILTVALTALALLSTGCGEVIRVEPVMIKRPMWTTGPDFQVERGVNSQGEPAFVVSPPGAFAESQIRVQQHIAELHAAPFWEGEKPAWLLEWLGGEIR
jgi:hypothetical protein